MTNYITNISYDDSTKKYTAIVKLAESDKALFTSDPCDNTERALQQTREFFLKNRFTESTTDITSTVKEFKSKEPPAHKHASGRCCGR